MEFTKNEWIAAIALGLFCALGGLTLYGMMGALVGFYLGLFIVAMLRRKDY